MTITCVIASANHHKVRELQCLLGAGPWQLQSLQEYPSCVMPPEDGATFEQNACRKAEAVTAATGHWSIGDDSGLVVDVLGGVPGIFSARYAGIPTDDARNNARLLADLINVSPKERGAQYVCVLALARPGESTRWVRGACTGVIGVVPRGGGGFGYDPLFFLPQLGKTMAELAAEEKHRVSHRGQAARGLRLLLLARIGEIDQTVRFPVGTTSKKVSL